MLLRAVKLLLFIHALGAKPWLVQQSFQEVLHGWVTRSIIAANIKSVAGIIIQTIDSDHPLVLRWNVAMNIENL